MKTLSQLTKEDIDNAFNEQMLNENFASDVIVIEGIPFRNVHMPLGEYAKKIGAIPWEETSLYGLFSSSDD